MSGTVPLVIVSGRSRTLFPISNAVGVATPEFFSSPLSHDRRQAIFHGKYPGGAERSVMWTRKVGDGTETTVEQALMRGLVTA